MRFLSFLRGYEPGLPRAVRERQSDGRGGVRAVLPRVRRTMPTTSGAVGSWACPIETPGQIDWSGTFTAPGSRAESGGWTTWSSVVHRDSHGGRVAEAVPCRRFSMELPGTSSSHAAGQAPGRSVAPTAARSAPCSGEPRVMIRRVQPCGRLKALGEDRQVAAALAFTHA